MVSTLFVKQHVILDVIAGILLVELIQLLITRFEIISSPSLNKNGKMGEVSH
jgi:membrane-associated phospholipid phosphatase